MTCRSDRGTIGIMLAIIAAGFITAVVSIAMLTGNINALTESSDIAQAAARSAAQEQNLDTQRTGDDSVVIDPNKAKAAAKKVIDQTPNAKLVAFKIDGDNITVTVGVHKNGKTREGTATVTVLNS